MHKVVTNGVQEDISLLPVNNKYYCTVQLTRGDFCVFRKYLILAISCLLQDMKLDGLLVCATNNQRCLKLSTTKFSECEDHDLNTKRHVTRKASAFKQ